MAEILTKNADTVAASAGEEIGLKYAVARREMPDCPCADKIVQDFDVVERDPEVWLVVETIGGCGAALDMVRRSLQAGKHVVTANKQLIAEHGVELFEIARENGVNLLFEASVGGGHPGAEPDDALPRREPHHIGERHPERDDELHPDADAGKRRKL